MTTVNLDNQQLFVVISRLITVIQKYGGIVYGTTVRDMIRRSHVVGLFDISMPKPGEEDDSLFNMFEYGDIQINYRSREDLYKDETYRPDLYDRFLIPECINCFFPRENIDTFSNYLANNPELVSKFIYDKGTDINNIWSIKFEITPQIGGFFTDIIKISTKNKIELNILYGVNGINSISQLRKIDFFCDGLYLTSDNNLCLLSNTAKDLSEHHFLSKEILKANILKDISLKIARISTSASLNHIDNMIKKGWTIMISNNKITIEQIMVSQESLESICPICIENIDKDDIIYSRSCCKSSIFHWTCWKDFLKSTQEKCCPLCRSDVTSNNSEIY